MLNSGAAMIEAKLAAKYLVVMEGFLWTTFTGEFLFQEKRCVIIQTF